MGSFKVSKKSNVLNLRFKFAPPPLEALGGGQSFFLALRIFYLHLRPRSQLKYKISLVIVKKQ